MRRLIAVFILVLLPLQWSAAAIAMYCGHEKAPEAQQHLGHHDAVTSADTSSGKPDGGPDTRSDDCAICHFGFVKLAISFHPAAVLVPRAFEHPEFRGARVLTHDPEGLFRPPQSARLQLPA